MTPRTLPVSVLIADHQLVLGLDVGVESIRARKRRRSAKRPHPWLPVAEMRAAA